MKSFFFRVRVQSICGRKQEEREGPPIQMHILPDAYFDPVSFSEESGVHKILVCKIWFTPPPPPKKRAQNEETLYKSVENPQNCHFGGGGERNFIDKTILWTSGRCLTFLLFLLFQNMMRDETKKLTTRPPKILRGGFMYVPVLFGHTFPGPIITFRGAPCFCAHSPCFWRDSRPSSTRREVEGHSTEGHYC